MRGGGVLLVAPASRLAARLGARTYLTSFCRTGVPTSWQYARSYLNGRVVHLRRVELLIAACFILLPRIHHHATVVEGVRVSIASTLSFILFSKTSIFTLYRRAESRQRLSNETEHSLPPSRPYDPHRRPERRRSWHKDHWTSNESRAHSGSEHM
jgi:hypothetical protein